MPRNAKCKNIFEIKRNSFSTLRHLLTRVLLVRHYFLPRRRRLNHPSLRPLLITRECLIDGRRQLSRQILMEKFHPTVRQARPNENATMQNKWFFKISLPC